MSRAYVMDLEWKTGGEMNGGSGESENDELTSAKRSNESGISDRPVCGKGNELGTWFQRRGDRRPRDISLAASSGTGQLQTGAHGISSTAWHGVGVLNQLFPVLHLSGLREFVVCGCHLHFSCSSRRAVWQPSAVARFLLQHPSFRIPCLSTSRRHHRSQVGNGKRLKTFLFQQSFPGIII